MALVVQDVELGRTMAVEKEDEAGVGDGVMDADPEDMLETDSVG